MRNEEPPNKAVHADDLAVALAKLHARPAPNAGMADGLEGGEEQRGALGGNGAQRAQNSRTRSGSSTVVYHPDDRGRSRGLPAVMVEDTTAFGDEESADDSSEAKIMAHTARPPMELMQDA